MKKELMLFVLAAAILVFSTGCRTARADSGAVTADITVVTTEFRFIPDTLTLKTGDRVRLTLDNSDGKLPHDLVQTDLRINVVAQPRQKAAVEFVVTKKGMFDFICSVAGHRAAGMVGKVIVRL